MSCQTKKTASVTPIDPVKPIDSTKQVVEAVDSIIEMKVEIVERIDTVVLLEPQRADTAKRIDSLRLAPIIEVSKKPIIYIYPEENIEVNIKLNLSGELTHTYPKYNEKSGWNVKASPNGTLINKSNNKEYYALFWEGTTMSYNNPTTGFVVKGAETAAFLDEKLETLGLNRREANEFIVYWLPRMENNAYNLIHFAGAEYTNKAQLKITPQPETLIRVFMLFQGLEKEKTISPQILKPIKRKGYTVVEWGGSELNSSIIN